MTYQQAFKAAQAMIRYGGSFASAIGEAYLCADSSNSQRLLTAFADLFERYVKYEN